MAKKKSKKKQENPKVHEELEGMNIRINSLGEIEANYDVAKLNEFLNRKTDDRKLQSHPEWSDEQAEDEHQASADEEDEKA